MRVLVVDDDPLLRAILRSELLRAGLEVSTSENGADALRAAASEAPDVIIMDLAMPVLDGWNAQTLMRSGMATAEIPVILLSAHASESERQKFLAAGFAEVVQKPYEIRVLLDHIGRLGERDRLEETG